MGLLASKAPTRVDGVPELLYTMPSGQTGTVNINVANRGGADSTFRLWISRAATAAAVVDAEMIEPDTPLKAKGGLGSVVERTAIPLDPGDTIYFAGGSLTQSFGVWGVVGVK